MAGVGLRRPGAVDVEAEYAPRHSPGGAVCDRERRDLLAPVAARKPGPRRNWRPTIAALTTHGRSRGHRHLHNRAPGQHRPSSRSSTSAHESRHADRKRKPSKSVHGGRRRPSAAHRHRDTAQPGRHQSRGLTHKRSHTDRVRYADRVNDFADPCNRQVDSNACFKRDSACRSYHVSCADPGYRDGNTCSEHDGQSFRARHN
jgi:hypothetical protein